MNEQLDDIRARRAAITPGVWGTKAVDNGGAMDELQIVSNTGRGSMFVATVGDVDIADVQADAVFIAAAPGDVDTLLAMVDALTGERDDLRRLTLYWKSQASVAHDRRDAVAAERDAIAAQLAQAQRELAAVPVDAMRLLLWGDATQPGYVDAVGTVGDWLIQEQEAANAAAEMRAPTYNGGCW